MDWEITPQMQARLDAINEKEKDVEIRLDEVSHKIAKTMGYQDVPWFILTWVLLWIYTGLTLLIMMKREDFINLTVCVTGLFMMFNTDSITRLRFRILVGGIILSLFVDLFWFVMKHQEYSTEQQSDGGLETGIRKVVLALSYISFIVRVIIIQFHLITYIDIGGDRILEGFNGLHRDNTVAEVSREDRDHCCLVSREEN